jgi:hypothetical protein
MQLFSFRRFIPVLAVVALCFLASCAANSRKYGCPNKLQLTSLIR